MKQLFTILILMWAYQATSYAKMYKWVDADGKTNYTAYPSPDGTGKEIKAPPPPSAVVKKVAVSNTAKKTEIAKKKEKEHPEIVKVKKQFCADARKNLTILQNSHRHVFKDPKTNALIYYDDKTMAKKTKEANNNIKQYCK